MSQQLALKVKWIHPPQVERWLRRTVIRRTLNVCCGMSRVGEVRVDTDEGTNRTEPGDLFDLRFPKLSFDTVICDPPFSYYSHFKWIYGLTDLARKLVILSAPTNLSIMLSRRKWDISLYAVAPRNTRFLRLYWMFERKDMILQ